jgi:hypothetical protein
MPISMLRQSLKYRQARDDGPSGSGVDGSPGGVKGRS